MKRCEKCRKPFSDFEARFHREAGSPLAVSEKCWCCCGADQTFKGTNADGKGYKKQIAACIAGIAVLLIGLLPLVPFLNSYDLPLLLEIYSKIYMVACILVGVLVSRPVLSRLFAHYKKQTPRIDPPEQRYGKTYSPITTHIEAKERYDGAIIFSKVTRGGADQVDRWEWDGASNDRVSGILGAYGTFVEKCIYLMVYAFVGCSFVFWAVPYLVYAFVREKMAGEARRKIPMHLQKAYKTSVEAARPMPLSYHDKVGFLVSREECKKAPAAPHRDKFLASFSQEAPASAEKRLPFFFKRYGTEAYMIVDYKEHNSFGATFVLVKDGNAPIEKRIVVADRFAESTDADWRTDWKELGASDATIGYMAWYENKLVELLKNPKKEILG